MPSGKVHAAVSTVVSGFVLAELGGDFRWILLAPVAGLFPDTDSQRSILGRMVPLWILFKHRKAMHSYYMMLMLTVPFVVLYPNGPAALVFLTGYLSHIWLDWLFSKKRGVALWWPMMSRESSLRKWLRGKKV